MRLSPHNRQAFTLVEIMIVVTIIALLASIAIPAFNRARQNSRYGNINNNLRNLSSGVNQYFLERGRSQVAFSEIIDRDAYVSVFSRIASEEYGAGRGLDQSIENNQGLYSGIDLGNSNVATIHNSNNSFSSTLAANVIADNNVHSVVFATSIAGAPDTYVMAVSF